jgi:DNA-binding SARP family transcriptional activator
MARSVGVCDAEIAPCAGQLTLAGEFALAIDGQTLTVPHSVERVLAFLALADRSVSRAKLAGALWLDRPEERAAKGLRTALWRLHRMCADLVVARDDRLQLSPRVTVDATELSDLAGLLIRQPDSEAIARFPLLVERAELLPDWDDDWVVTDRERFRLLRLEALERVTSTLLDQGRLGEAVIVALAVVQTDPLRESARRLLMQVHFARGNVGTAIATYREYRTLLHREFGVEPSTVMTLLLEDYRAAIRH